MFKAKWWVVTGVLFWISGLAVAMVLAQDDLPPLPSTISGVVVGTDGPLPDAVVQLKGTPNLTETAEDGSFTLDDVQGTPPVVVTAWSEGYYVGWATLDPAAPDWQGGNDTTITLRPLFQKDNYEYHWFSFQRVDGSASCGLCHREYGEWQADQHSRAAINERFLNIYTGTDVNGNEGQLTVMGDDGRPLPPDPNQPHHGPGYLLDNPERAGNCATCHTPLASTAPNNQNCSWSGCHKDATVEAAKGLILPNAVLMHLAGAAADGIACDFCHKIGDVILDPETHLPLADMPGILSMRLYRPEEGEQIFFGMLVDVDRRVSYLPLLASSDFCAACHYGVFGSVASEGTVIYNSYGEWLDSPYSDPETGQTCQDCHMPVSDAKWFVYAERGGITRDYAELHAHTMPGAADEHLLQNSVTMESHVQRNGDQLQVEVSITNDKTGHHIPTDAPMRSMILVVEALDADGQPLALTDGPVNPEYSGNYGGLPGKTFAKVLRDDWTGEAPTAAYWRPVTIVEDSRIAALATDTTRYTFDVPAGDAVTVNVQLIFRRNFAKLMEQKGWDDPDILMEHDTLQVQAS